MKYLLPFQKSINFHKIFARMSRSATHGLFLSQAIEWTLESENGWFKKSLEQWRENTFLTRREIENAVQFWSGLGVLKVEARGMPRTTHYLVDDVRLQSAIQQFVDSHADTEIANLRSSVCYFEQTSLPEVTNKFARNDKLDEQDASGCKQEAYSQKQQLELPVQEKCIEKKCDSESAENESFTENCEDFSKNLLDKPAKSSVFSPHTPLINKLSSLDISVKRKSSGVREKGIDKGIGKGVIGEKGKGKEKGNGEGECFSAETQAILQDLQKLSGFSELWEEYLDYRRKRKWPMTNRAILSLLTPLAKHKTVAVPYLEHTLTCGYRGIREEWIVNFTQQHKKTFSKTKKIVDICQGKATFDV